MKTLTFSRNVANAGLAAVLVFGAVNAGADVMLSDFDTGGPFYGGVQGWFGYGDAAAVSTIVNPTGGNSTWMVKSPGQYYGSCTMQSWANPALNVANINANTDLQFDLILPGSGPHAWLQNNTSQTINIALQLGGGTLGSQDHNADVTFDGSIKDQIIHIDFNYNSAFGTYDPTATFANLSLNTSPGYNWVWDSNNPNAVPYAAQLYIDNVQLTSAVVPEPSALALCGMGGLCLALLRRR